MKQNKSELFFVTIEILSSYQYNSTKYNEYFGLSKFIGKSRFLCQDDTFLFSRFIR